MSSDSRQHRILYAGNDSEFETELAQVFFEEEDPHIIVVNSFEGVQSVLGNQEFDCIVSDDTVGDKSGKKILQYAKEQDSNILTLLFSDTIDDIVGTQKIGESPIIYIDKNRPQSYDTLSTIISSGYDQLDNVIRSVKKFTDYRDYPMPEDEDERLQAVKRYDTKGMPADETFDRLTQIASAFFDVDVALIGLVEEDKEELIACYGANVTSLARENSICTFAILADDVMVVDDVANDPRFEDVQYLQDSNINWYAGVPLRTQSGHVIGTFCLVDSEQQEFTDEDKGHLAMFGRETIDQLELRRQVREDDS